ncbi:hypothetical protein MHO82_14255 [Vibrio sp. Of7-15]|uniref:hypothetical protein n=1 Tax=Vibrio sp. Of7-15 TaxID=2724879 RepID=UPI001EF23D67|nr:hypothetical protein [Vibrio sp. Of7-15]MCG7498029.1 hypothetical protein [Vibrio sp. Of7-15]
MKLNVKKTVLAKLSKDADSLPVEIERETAEQVAGGWPTLSVGLSCMRPHQQPKVAADSE